MDPGQRSGYAPEQGFPNPSIWAIPTIVDMPLKLQLMKHKKKSYMGKVGRSLAEQTILAQLQAGHDIAMDPWGFGDYRQKKKTETTESDSSAMKSVHYQVVVPKGMSDATPDTGMENSAAGVSDIFGNMLNENVMEGVAVHETVMPAPVNSLMPYMSTTPQETFSLNDAVDPELAIDDDVNMTDVKAVKKKGKKIPKTKTAVHENYYEPSTSRVQQMDYTATVNQKKDDSNYNINLGKSGELRPSFITDVFGPPTETDVIVGMLKEKMVRSTRKPKDELEIKQEPGSLKSSKRKAKKSVVSGSHGHERKRSTPPNSPTL